MRKSTLIIGSNSILSKQLVIDLGDIYDIDIAYSGDKSGVEKAENVDLISINNLFLTSKTYNYVIIISAFIPDNKTINTQKLVDVNVSLIEKITLKFNQSKIIFCSSVSVYSPTSNVITEKTAVNPINEYGISKLWAEKIIERNCQSYAIFRISSLIGAGMKNNTFIPLIIDNALTHKKITILGNGSRLQNYINVCDVSKLIISSLSYNENELFLAVSKKSYSNTEIANTVKKIANCDIVYQGIDNSLSVSYDNTDTIHTLNFNEEKNIETSIKEIIAWKQKQ